MHAICLLTLAAEFLHISNLHEPIFERDMVDALVVEPILAKTLTSLTMSYARVNVFGKSLAPALWSADLVEGKGSGLIFLLHGTPGVGKTFTAGMSSNING
jgi:SpoVK/Ycf46/Vps4 family AAA+-type ATPase